MTSAKRKQKDEQGAYAVLFAILAVFLVGVAALAVDLGNAMARKTDSQGQADFAALAAGGVLPTGVPTSGVLADMANADPAWMAVVDEARDYLNNNTPQDDTCAGTECVTSSDLIDHDPINGEVLFAHEYGDIQGSEPDRCAENGLCVISPRDTVSYGLARVFGSGFDTKQIQADATIGIFSPDLGPMPVYAVDGCDYGRQTITDPANGQLPPIPVPTLLFPDDDNGATLSYTPWTITPNQSGQTITITGSQFDSISKIGFFNPDNSTVVDESTFTPVAPYSANNNASITVTVPSTVYSVETLWYVRIFSNAGASPNTQDDKYSPEQNAVPLRVGDAVLECNDGSNDGNFGTLLLERSDVASVNDQLAMNIATKLQEPLSLAVHTWAINNGNGECTDGSNGAIESGLPNPGQFPGTNCLDTDTGLPANAATMGLVTGVAGHEGRLARAGTTTDCSPDGDSDERTLDIQNSDYTINDDILSCFLTNGTTSLADISSEGYTGGTVLDDSIYDSPRFFVVPVLKVDPSTGGSNTYSIIDFRPAFITDEVVSPTTLKGTHTATSENGVFQDGNDIKQVKVVFFNINALPPKLDGPVTDYLGTGPKILRLID